ncbi:Adenine deaminase [Dyadobacter sp. CECT 9275]|uniref:Adenine deaminase n=1 Tax=Dyadobacter helix TaxID=2822344 RepID=A0A916J8D2_9BACT|nr:adenine deaminase [Dyadobacter sp. CECT 9275]CAG4993229.1 Adenine deaminase [Dyadobacter sp. CECT 9275]
MIANLVNLFDKTIQKAEIFIDNGFISSLNILGPENPAFPYVLPGFVDAHVHIESSMLTPVQFARLAVVHGTVATVSDPHEIANVLGVDGVHYMIEDGKRVPFKFCFGAPSCVPATVFETAGAVIDPEDIRQLLEKPEIGYLAEVMNFPAVLNNDPEMIAKINWAKHYQKPIDGHAPGLRGTQAKTYAEAGMTTDHECFTYAEAREKISYGVKILIREGSAARNFDALIPLLAEFPEQIMFCSDDKHPDNLVEGHINLLVKRALALGYDLWNVLHAACLNPVLHYRLPVGLLRVNDPADFITIDNLTDFNILQTWLNGALVAANGASLLPDLRSLHVNQFDCLPKTAADFECPAEKGSSQVRVIETIEGQLITNAVLATLSQENGLWQTAPEKDILKITVVNRYRHEKPAVAFIKNFGLKAGAIASSVGHDSHNIISIGSDDASIAKAVNLIIECKGGISAVNDSLAHVLPLPIAGLMTDTDGYQVADMYTAMDRFVKDALKSTLKSPYMSLSFMALLVIPSLKLSDKGLFDGEKFQFVPVSQELYT